MPWGPDMALQYGNVSWLSSRATPKPCRSLSTSLKKNDPPGAEAILNEVLANPKLDAHAPRRLLADFELGKLYSGRLHQTEKAAEAFAKVLAHLMTSPPTGSLRPNWLAFWAMIQRQPT